MTFNSMIDKKITFLLRLLLNQAIFFASAYLALDEITKIDIWRRKSRTKRFANTRLKSE